MHELIKSGLRDEFGRFKKGIATAKTHGYSGTRTYRIWNGMIMRCYNPNRNNYERYGAKGIRVCKRWRIFVNFLQDMGEAPIGKSLDRFPDRKGNYKLSNCRWATASEQAQNSKTVRPLTLDGVTKFTGVWERELGLSKGQIRLRLLSGWTLRKALTTPNLLPRR